jgi:hypothetical protein
MNIDQCVEMMESLRDKYNQIAGSGEIKEREVYKLKNVLMQIDLSMISMRRNVTILEKKLKLLKHPTNKKLKEVSLDNI